MGVADKRNRPELHQHINPDVPGGRAATPVEVHRVRPNGRAMTHQPEGQLVVRRYRQSRISGASNRRRRTSQQQAPGDRVVAVSLIHGSSPPLPELTEPDSTADYLPVPISGLRTPPS